MSSPAPTLKPMTAGDILDQAVRIFRQNFVPLVTIVALINLPVILLQVIAAVFAFPNVGPGGFTSNSFQDFGPGFIIFYVASFVVGLISAFLVIFQQAALAIFVSERFLGRPVTVRQAYGKAFSRGLSLFLAAVVIFIVYFLFVLLFLVPFVGVALVNTGGGGDTTAAGLVGVAVLCTCVLFTPAFCFFLFLNTRWLFHQQAIVIENYNSTGGLGRSWKLVKGTFWRVFGFSIILAIIVTVVSAGPIYALSFATFFLPFSLSIALNGLASGLITIVMTPLQMAALTVLYYDVRIRKEGFDLQFQMQSSAPSEPFRGIMEPTYPVEPAQPPATTTPPADATPSSEPSTNALPPLFDRTPPAEPSRSISEFPPPNTLSQPSSADPDKPSEQS